MIITDKKMNDISFWRDSSSIENYALSILKYCNKEVQLKINIASNDSIPRCAYTGNDRFNITLPKPKDHYYDQENEQKDILLRKVFLKHEISHILYSDFNLFNDHHSAAGTSFHYIWNALEDVRIENLFGKKFKGANDYFFEVQDVYYLKSKKYIEKAEPSIQNLGSYFLFRSKGKSFSQTPATDIYEKLFMKYSYFINLSASDLKDLIYKIIESFDSLYQVKSEIQEEPSKEEPQYQNSEAQEEDSKEQEDANQEAYNSNEDQNSMSDSADSEDKEDNSDSQSGSNSDDEDSSEDSSSKEISSDTNEEAETGTSASQDVSSMIQDMMKETIENEKKSFDESMDDSSEIDKEREDLKSSLQKEIVLCNGLPLPTAEEISFYKKILKNVNDFCSFKEGSLDVKESELVPMRRFYKRTLSLVKRDEMKNYNEVVKNNKKNIIGITNYFRLKFQNKENKKLFNNREEGVLNNDDLFKILIKDKNDSTIFSKIESSIVSKSNVVFLLDFSSSMQGSNSKSVIETMIIMNEVFCKLKIPYELYSFSGSREFKLHFNNKKIPNTNSLFGSNVYTQPSRGGCTLNLKNTSKNPLFKLRSITDLDYETDRKILAKFLNQVLSGSRSNGNIELMNGSTPEIESVLSLRKNVHFKNKKLFILNDGEYNTIHKTIDISKEQSKVSEMEGKYSYIGGKILYSLLIGNEIEINSPSDIDIFKNLAASLRSLVKIDNIIRYFYSYTQKKENTEIINFINSLSLCFDDFDYNAMLKKNKMKIDSSSHVNVNQSGKNIKISLSIDKSSFSLLGTKPNYNGTSLNSGDMYLGREDWDYVSLASLICQYIISKSMKNSDSYYFNPSFEDRIYKSLILNMRNNGWEIYGLGIESNRGKNYIGERNFTVVKNHEIKTELQKRIKQIV